MRPYVLQGHTRPLTQVVYNREGDLIFTTAKDNIACVWFSNNGERLGTLGSNDAMNKFRGQHRSAVWGIDVTFDTLEACTASADQTVKLWDVSNGKVTRTIQFESTTRCVNYSTDGNLFAVTQDRQMSAYNKVLIVDKRVNEAEDTKTEHRKDIVKQWKLSNVMQMGTRVLWGHMDNVVITGNEKGLIKRFDWRNVQVDEDGVGAPECQMQGHKNAIKDMKLSKDRTLLITASKDKTAKIFDVMGQNSIDELKSISHPTNCNTAAFNPIKPHVACAGGQEAMDVTTTAASQGYFETFIYNMITNEPVCSFKGHFGPVNYLAFHPDGSQICTGGEEGYIRLNHLDQAYVEYRDIDLELAGQHSGQAIAAV